MHKKALLKSIAVNFLFLIAGGIIGSTIFLKCYSAKIDFANKFQNVVKKENPTLLATKLDFANNFQDPVKASKVETRTLYNTIVVNGKTIVTDSAVILASIKIDLSKIDYKAVDRYISPVSKHKTN